MSYFFTKIRDKHALWYKGLVFVFSVVICTYLLPKNTSWKTINVKVGDVWTSSDIVSSINFLVKKTATDISSDKSITHDKIPYFKKQPINIKHTLQLNGSIDNTTLQLIYNCLDTIYSKGVCLNFKINNNSDSLFYLVNNHDVSLTHLNTVYTNTNQIESTLNAQKINSELIDTIIKSISSNILYDEGLSSELNTEKKDTLLLYKSKIEQGATLIHKNDIVTQQQIDVINSYNDELIELEKESSSFSLVLGQFLTCVLILGIMMLFLVYFRKVIFSQNTHVSFVFLIIILLVLSSNVVCFYNQQFVYAVPFCLAPILIRIFFDSRTSLFNFLNIVLLCSFFTTDKFEFVFIQLIAGIGTIFSVADMGRRSKLFVSAGLIFSFYIIAFISYHLINQTEAVIFEPKNYIPFLISSVCVLFSFPLIFLFEKLFGFISNFTLLELCDLNSPLLRQLSQKIPGTFQHSLQVANLAEEACYKIGGNALLVRTGAMYHDIGKIENSRFFTENQVGEVSPHEDLNPEESAKIIIDHIIKGVEKAKEHKLPEIIIDFIRTHHGTTTTRFFLHNYQKAHQGEIINEAMFRYPGPIPFSKETAILMMADSVEASSRSLKKYDALTIDALVDKIIDHQINENQFINSDITFRDINQIKKIFKKRLMNIYHVRIEYPR